jgi:membrane associated rhomboid family serine protease
VKFLGFYLVAGVVAALSHLLIDPHSHSPLVGASGAISGVMGAYLLLYPRNRVRALILFYLITVVEVRAIYLLGLWFLWQLVQGLLAVGLSHQVSVAFFAHVGGFVAGLVMMLVYRTVFDRRGRGDDGSYVEQL